jgi:cytidylate kinase
MTASVVTFSTQIGSGGSRIARVVAEKLRFRYYNWEVISQAASEAGVSPEVLAIATSERSPGFFDRMMARLAGLGAGEDPSTETVATPRLSMMNSEDYRQFLEYVVRELGNQGDAVIVNHSGQVILKDAPGVFKVLVTGSLDRRAARLAQQQNRDLPAAQKTIEDSDRQRTDYFRRVYHTEWLDMGNYDLAINTDRVAADLAADMVATAARQLP